METSATEILGLSNQELTDLVGQLGQPAYRAQQLFHAIYRQRISSLDELTTFPKSLRAAMTEQRITLSAPKIDKKFVSVDGTIRYLIAFPDGQSVETVWMPEGDGGEAGDGTDAGDEEEPTSDSNKKNYDRATICVSSQVGCAVNCKFCMTALLGLKRNLTAGEIVGQITAILNDHSVDLDKERINIVFMGQGEPFNNYDAFIKAVRLLVEGVGFPQSRMTVSTSGVVPRIYDLGQEPVRPKLAISLNASNDEERTKLIPINKKWDIASLVEAARAFPLRNRERLTFEYVLLDNENDSPDNARQVVQIIRALGDKADSAKVNLIAWNSGPEIPFSTPSDSRVHAFQKILIDAGIPAFIRRPRGRDIYAACGQLKRTQS
ncbi:MAG: rRNA m(2)A-2503 methyltransferase [Candidatus Angelobacter sp.]|jgi:23S rRNA (adenine2503-C2)-methyltransferase|nr:rRNA m(2)A-2503 methyltransferase [Candidatus Angelobacter sp.]